MLSVQGQKDIFQVTEIKGKIQVLEAPEDLVILKTLC